MFRTALLLSPCARGFSSSAALSRTVMAVLDEAVSTNRHRDSLRSSQSNKRNFPVLPHDDQDHNTQTYGEMERHVNAAACGLQDLSFGPGDHIVAALDNSFEIVVLLLAAAKIGATVLPFDSVASADTIRTALKSSKAQGFFAEGKRADLLAELFPEGLSHAAPLKSAEFPSVKHVVHTGDVKYHKGFHQFRHILVYGEIATNTMNKAASKIDDGTPFFVEKNKAVSQAEAVKAAEGLCAENALKKTDRVVVASPLTEASGILSTIAAFSVGAAVVLPSPRFNAGATVAAIKKEQAPVLFALPDQVSSIKGDPSFSEEVVKCLRKSL